MSFFDELQNAPNEAKEEEKLQLENSWKKLKEILTEHIKGQCLYVAKSGVNNTSWYLKDGINYIEDEYTSKSDSRLEFDNSTESLFWIKLREKFFYFRDTANERYGSEICGSEYYHYPHSFGMSKQDAEELANYLKEYIQTEGLQAQIYLKREYCKGHHEEKFIKYSSSFERLLLGKNGYYKRMFVEDEQMYSFFLDITW